MKSSFPIICVLFSSSFVYGYNNPLKFCKIFSISKLSSICRFDNSLFKSKTAIGSIKTVEPLLDMSCTNPLTLLLYSSFTGLTTFYFNDRNNKDFQDYSGRQYNSYYEFGGKVIEEIDDRTLIEIRNKLSVGDTLELIIPGKIEPLEFKIEKLWDAETKEEIDTVNPGRAEQKVILKIPTKVEKDWIIRRKKRFTIIGFCYIILWSKYRKKERLI